MNFREHPINRSWIDAERIDLLRTMLRIRRFEQAALKRYQCGEINGWLLLSIGQESVAACTRSVMSPLDHGISGFRGMGHALAAGMDMDACMAELMGFTEGCSKGKAGACGFYAPHLHHWGCHATAGSQTPLAAGLAFGLVHRKEAGAVVCFLGDGAVNTGAYHEALNLSGLFGLPVVFLIENNGYAMGTSVARSSVFRNCLAERAEAYGIDWDRFSDADPFEMRVRIGTALDRARTRHRPSVIEIETYRYHGFTISDANHKRYRSPEEIENQRATDPLQAWQKSLIEDGILDVATAEEIDVAVRNEVIGAVAAAKAGTRPQISDIRSDVYYEWDHRGGSSPAGRHFFDPD